MFTHLHGHSHYSLLEGMGKPGDIVNKIKELGMDSVAITDHSSMYGAVEFYEIAHKNDIKPIIGVELSIVSDIHKKDPNEDIYNIVLVAKHYDGYLNLMKLVSVANLDGFNNVARIDWPLLEQYGDGLLAFMGGTDSQIGKMITNGEKNDIIEEKIQSYKDLFGQDSFFLEIIAQKYTKESKLLDLNNRISELAKNTNTKLLVNSNFSYLNQDDKEAYEVLLCIRDGKNVYAQDREKISGDYHIMSEQEIIGVLKDNGFDNSQIDELIQNNEDFKNLINVEIPLGKILFPKYESPEDINKLYGEYKDKLVTD